METITVNQQTGIDLVLKLVSKGVQLYTEDERLCFHAPKGLLTPEDMMELKVHKAEIISFLNQRRVLKLSSLQARLWFLSRLDTSAVGYEFCFSFRIQGALDEAAFTRSFEKVVHRHPGLRTTFETIGGQTVQMINPAQPVPAIIKTVDHSFESPAQDELMRSDLIKPFQYEDELLLRSILYKQDQNNYIWGLCLHHIIADGWSFGLLLDELSRNYRQELQQESKEVLEAPFNYGHYVEWERVQEEDKNHPGYKQREENLEFWIDKLKDSPPLDFKSDYNRPSIRTYGARRVFFTMPADTVADLKQLALENKSTLNACCLTLFNVLLYHYTRQVDVAVGTPHANRFDQSFESVMGCFISTLVMRNQMQPEGDFIQALNAVTQTAFEAYEHQDYSFEKLTSELVTNRDLSRNSLFQVLFVFQNALSELSLPDLSSDWYVFDPRIGQFELELHLRTTGTSIECTLIYNSDLYSESSMERFAKHYQYLAQQIRANQELAIQDLSLLSREERRRIVFQWNQSTDTLPAPETLSASNVLEKFLEQVSRTPSRNAVVCEGTGIKYQELNQEADRIAKLIGPARGRFIGIMIPRSIEMVAGLLGILKAGGAFVPLDPEFPAKRISYMVENSGLDTILSHTECEEQISELTQSLPVKVLLVDQENTETQAVGEEVKAPVAGGETPAYLIYTSGSTGNPKGVLVSHRNLFNLLQSMAREPGISPEDRWLAVTTLSFDISILELFLPLLNGAELVVATQADTSDGKRLADLIESSRASIMQATPATWKLLLNSGWRGASALKILCGGEALERDIADQLLEHAELWNVYGPTETTIWSLTSRVGKEGPVLLGRPIDNTRTYVLDERRQPVALGIPGELYIAGEGCSLGYWRNETATARQFVNLKAITGFDERAYNTGDMVKYDGSGNLIYLGRKDQQLKVRGYRIEAGDIETALREVPGLVDGAVIKQDETIAAYVCVENNVPTQEQILHNLKQSLPAYMLPGQIWVLDSLPMTPNGKVDRKRLLQAGARRLNAQTEGRNTDLAPLSPMETYVAQLFSELLNVDTVGRYDDFFNLGGHSLLAARVQYSISSNYSIEIELQTLLSHSTVKALATILENETTNKKSEDEAIADILARLESMSDEDAVELMTSTQN